MIAGLGRGLSAVFARTAPDPLVLAVLLTAATGTLAYAFGTFPDQPGTARVWQVVDAWRGTGGMWKFLGFSMQMCLILVTGHALAESPPVRSLIRSIASRPGGTGSAAALVALVAMGFGLINWGLGLIVGALLARDVARRLSDRGVRAHGPLLAAAGYAGMLVWHGGLSGSAPIFMTQPANAAAVLPPETVAMLGADAAIPLTRTVLAPTNLIITGGMLLIVPALLWMLAPKPDRCVAMPAGDDLFEDPRPKLRSMPDWLEHTPAVPLILAALLGLSLWRFVTGGDRSPIERLGSIGPDEINTAMLALGLVAHGSVRSYLASAERGARGCVGIILQFPLYAGIMGLLAGSGLIGLFSDWLSAGANADTIALRTFVGAGVVNLFVPSGGGQWAIQGPIALDAGSGLGVAPEKMVMAVAYGDQLTNMLQPFWALPLLAVTGVRARDIVGYTAIVMVVAGAWIALWLTLR